MPIISANGIDIYYEQHGVGPPLVMTHGFSGCTEEWRLQVLPLAAKRQLILYDVRGHGRTTAPADAAAYSMETFAADLRALMLKLGIERAHIGGVSMGGMIAVRFALDYPQMVASLLLCDTTAGNGQPDGEAGRFEYLLREYFSAMEHIAVKYGLSELAERLIAWARANDPHHADNPEPEDMTRQRLARISVQGYLGALRAIRDRPDLVHRLGEVRAPTLVLVGEWDNFLASARVAHQAIVGSRFVLIRRSGHGTPTWRPQAFQRAVSEFLDGVEAGRAVGGEFEL
ncbi:MAG: alpha/beta fold hydrolase [Dehalococcoidia bacterium]